MNQIEATALCAAKGPCWRLPTADELDCMLEIRSQVPGGIADLYYWSSTMSSDVSAAYLRNPIEHALFYSTLWTASMAGVKCVR
jgi:hypothetical protein